MNRHRTDTQREMSIIKSPSTAIELRVGNKRERSRGFRPFLIKFSVFGRAQSKCKTLEALLTILAKSCVYLCVALSSGLRIQDSVPVCVCESLWVRQCVCVIMFYVYASCTCNKDKAIAYKKLFNCLH